MTALLAPGAAPALAADPVATYTSDVNTDLAGNPTCNSVEATYAGGQNWSEFKIEGADLGNGTVTDGALSVTISGFDGSAPGQGFSWSSNFGVDAVIIKTGNGNGGINTLAVYAPTAGSTEATSGSLTTASATGISHISFCYDAGTPPTPTPTTAPTPTPTNAPTPTPTLAPTPTPTGSPAPTEATATPTGGVGGATGTPGGGAGGATSDPTLPSTSTIDGTGSGPTGDGWRIILFAMAGLLAVALLLTPAKAVIRKDDTR
jgi:hypothetical protein